MLLITDASEWVFVHLLVINGGISKIVTLPLFIAESAIGRMTVYVSSPKAEKHSSRSGHFPQ